MRLLTGTLKYAAIGRISLRNHLAYVYDFLVRTIFLVLIMYIFLQLWRVTFQGEGTERIAGYSYPELIWYIIFAEALTMATPSLPLRIEDEVKSGDIGYKLIRPVNYIAMQYVTFMGEMAVRLIVNVAVGFLIGFLAFGLPHFGGGWAGFAVVSLFAMTVQFMLGMLIALCAFWVEETRGIEFVYNKLLFTIGGMLMPLELMPETLQHICSWLPFQTVLYFPAKTAVHFDLGGMAQMIGVQLIWIAVLSLGVAAVYRKGVGKLNVNGG
ncbi:ABC transporter permease [Paenibacillus thalictri]|uniref:ABC transporter permease n=1 Tax=Paenibacillus thalictri TaxID=2527873 RepID=A0A4Q9E0Q7_9BACL|nr:ABC-2 family transporter protein [Paenibacillus thalictri]TBL81828.1 ABC transporter permease [Paenibacillus thalictri]